MPLDILRPHEDEQNLNGVRTREVSPGVHIPYTRLDIGTGDGEVPVEGALPVRNDLFTRLLKFEPLVGEEIRRAEQTLDDYHGIAPDGSATSATVWNVCRFYKDASGNIIRVRFVSGIAWDDRAAAGNWP